MLEDITTEKTKLLFNTGLSYTEAADRGQEVIVNYIGLIDALAKREVDEGEVHVSMHILACAPLLDARHADCNEGPRLLRRRLRADHDGCRSLSLQAPAWLRLPLRMIRFGFRSVCGAWLLVHIFEFCLCVFFPLRPRSPSTCPRR